MDPLLRLSGILMHDLFPPGLGVSFPIHVPTLRRPPIRCWRMHLALFPTWKNSRNLSFLYLFFCSSFLVHFGPVFISPSHRCVQKSSTFLFPLFIFPEFIIQVSRKTGTTGIVFPLHVPFISPSERHPSLAVLTVTHQIFADRSPPPPTCSQRR